MHLRPMILADIPQCATINDAAFEADELSNFLAPNRAKHPLSWRQHTLRSRRSKYYQPNVWGFVCIADADDDFAAEGEILGCARWSRRASKEDAATDPWMRRPMSVLDHLESWLCWAELQWEEKLRTNPAVSWAHQDAFVKAASASTGFTPVRTATQWYLDNLAVAPEYHRRGVARMLAQWGLQLARKETEERAAVAKAPVPVTLIGSAPGLHLYRSLKFKVVGWEDDSFLEFAAKGGSTMVWDPTGYWIEDVAFEQPMRRGVVEAIFITREPKNLTESLS